MVPHGILLLDGSWATFPLWEGAPVDIRITDALLGTQHAEVGIADGNVTSCVEAVRRNFTQWALEAGASPGVT